MTAVLNFFTSLFTELNAGFISTNVLESRFITQGDIIHHFLAESAFIKLLLDIPLFAVVSQVIRSGLTLRAEVFMAIEASDSALAEMLLSRLGYFLTISCSQIRI